MVDGKPSLVVTSGRLVSYFLYASRLVRHKTEWRIEKRKRVDQGTIHDGPTRWLPESWISDLGVCPCLAFVVLSPSQHCPFGVFPPSQARKPHASSPPDASLRSPIWELPVSFFSPDRPRHASYESFFFYEVCLF